MNRKTDSFLWLLPFCLRKSKNTISHKVEFQDSYNLLQFAHNLKMSTTAHQKITKLNTIRIYSLWEKQKKSMIVKAKNDYIWNRNRKGKQSNVLISRGSKYISIKFCLFFSPDSDCPLKKKFTPPTLHHPSPNPSLTFHKLSIWIVYLA